MVRTLEQSTMRKVYLRLLPFAVLSYILAYIDRINVSFAGLTMRGDLEMSAGTFGFAVGMFYWGYFIFEVPSNVILEKVGARVWIARIMIGRRRHGLRYARNIPGGFCRRRHHRRTADQLWQPICQRLCRQREIERGPREVG
jgi:hypothetical protein